MTLLTEAVSVTHGTIGWLLISPFSMNTGNKGCRMVGWLFLIKPAWMAETAISRCYDSLRTVGYLVARIANIHGNAIGLIRLMRIEQMAGITTYPLFKMRLVLKYQPADAKFFNVSVAGIAVAHFFRNLYLYKRDQL